jgi:hypothetical protein
MLFTNKTPIEYESPAGFYEVAVGAALTLFGYVKGRRGLGLTLSLYDGMRTLRLLIRVHNLLDTQRLSI